MKKILINSIIILCFVACNGQQNSTKNDSSNSISQEKNNNLKINCQATAHILVALCDNKYQGIVQVPAAIGNGQNAATNLYWGTAYGIKTYFKNSKEWQFIKSCKIDSIKVERIVFKHKQKDFYLVADAYDGRFIKQTTEDLLKSCAGIINDTIMINNKIIGLYGNAKLLGYIGHDGLMDFKITEQFVNRDSIKRDCIILACYSKHFFTPHLLATKANPLVWTSNLMCPEAYTIHDALTAYVQNLPKEKVIENAINAYSNFQKCSKKAAGKLLVQGY
jgi:uncharacterized protein YcfL